MSLLIDAKQGWKHRSYWSLLDREEEAEEIRRQSKSLAEIPVDTYDNVI